MEGGGLLFISRPFIHVITGLAKGEMSLTEFYRTAIDEDVIRLAVDNREDSFIGRCSKDQVHFQVPHTPLAGNDLWALKDALVAASLLAVLGLGKTLPPIPKTMTAEAVQISAPALILVKPLV